MLIAAVRLSWVKLITEETTLVSVTVQLVLQRKTVSPWLKPKVFPMVIVVSFWFTVEVTVVLTLGRLLVNVSFALVNAPLASVVGDANK